MNPIRTPFRYPEDLKMDYNTHPQTPYDKSIRFPDNRHFGQLKLFTNELEFLLTYVCDENMNLKKKIVLYIGAGNDGMHSIYLTQMFPTIEFHYFDNSFDKRLYAIPNLKIFKRYFSDSDMETYKSLAKSSDSIELYLITDIRNLSYNAKKETVEEESKMIEDLTLQARWVETINPKYSMFKFRTPFPYPKVIEYLGKDYIEYFEGVIYKQPWAKITSAESRLVVKGLSPSSAPGVMSFKKVKYNLTKYEQQMFYHNSKTRQEEYTFPMSDYFVGLKINNLLTLNARYDTAFTITLLVQYFTRSCPEISEATMKSRIVKILDFVSKGDGLN